jgi:hypothetical protein
MILCGLSRLVAGRWALGVVGSVAVDARGDMLELLISVGDAM